jgi:hypothetical protein
MSAEPIRLRVYDARFYLRNVRTRMTFRYGVAHLTGYPILHARVQTESGDGRRAEGVAADALPPKWFDKDPAKDYRENVGDLMDVALVARDAYLALGQEPRTPFDLFREGLAAVMDYSDAEGLNHLTASFGSALFERAVADAASNAIGAPYHVLVRENLLGVDMAAVHPELAGVQPRDVVAATPMDTLWIRHTVGLADPILTADIAPAEVLDDGLCQSLEEYIARQGLRYFKVKVSGNLGADLSRLAAIAALLDAQVQEPYFVSLDGNEQYRTLDGFGALVAELQTRPRFRRFFGSILFIEQPLERGVALDETISGEMAALSKTRPVILDESDSDLDSFKRAARLGYRGVSTKNCKGIYKSLMNFALARHLTNGATDGSQYFMSGEDLVNAPIVPLHQDLATLATLGIPHAERNGHHYLSGLRHLSEKERTACLRAHPRLYAARDGVPQLNVERGRIHMASLQVPGYGLGVPIDYESMTPLEDWTFDSLGV